MSLLTGTQSPIEYIARSELQTQQVHNVTYEHHFPETNGSMSPKLTNGGTSRESIAEAVRARVRRRLERPLSLADQTGMPTLASLVSSKAYSTDFEQTFHEENKKNFSLSDMKRGVVESHSSGEIEALLEGSGPRRAASLADFLFRRKQTKLSAAVVNVIENPMTAMYDRSGVASPAHEESLAG